MPISISCTGCGQGYKVPDNAAGKATKCRKCGTVVNIPKTSALASKPMAPAEAPPADAFNFSVDDPPNIASVKKRRKGKKGLILALFGLMFLFFGCCLLPAGGVLGIMYLPQAAGIKAMILGGDQAMKYMPDDPQIIVSARLRDVADSELWAQIKKEVPDDLTAKYNETMAEAGLNADDMERSLTGINVNTQDFCNVTLFKKPVDVQKFLQAKPNKDKKFKEVKVGKYTVYEEETSNNQPQLLGPNFLQTTAYCTPEPKVLLMGSSKSVEAVLNRNKLPELSETMKATLKQADMKKALAVAVDVKAIKAKNQKNFEVASKLKGADKIDAAVLTITVKSDVVVDATVICEDDASAESLRKAVEGMIALAGGFMGPEVPSEVKDTINNVKFTNSGKTMLANVVVKGSDIVNGIQKAKKGMPPPGGPMPAPNQ